MLREKKQKNKTLFFLPTYLASEHKRDGAVGACYFAVAQHWRNTIQVLDAGRHALRARVTSIGQRSNRSLACASSHTARWLILARTLISRLSARQPRCAQWTRGQSGWAGSSGAAMLPVESPALEGLMMERRRGRRIRGEVRRDWVGRSASTLNVKISLCHALLSAERWGGLPLSCHWLFKQGTGRKIQRQKIEKEREEEGGQAAASWGLTETIQTVSEVRTLLLDSPRGKIEYLSRWVWLFTCINFKDRNKKKTLQILVEG